jgi:uncharacterized circularly permuted ATP-grasp superfamily protein/uncharacterized alpha-E superfamily protein
MIDTNPTDSAPSQQGGPSLFDAAVCPSNAFCEAFEPSGELRAHWQPVAAAVEATGFEELRQRQERVRRMRHEDGATYNPFDTPSGQGIPWALEMIPQPLTATEWSGLENGLIQRANLLETILADVYGPQNLLKNRTIPAELIYANPNFMHPCHGIQPAGDRYLTYYAADLYRAPDGRFRVLRDYAAGAAGVGYALENRIVISRFFSDLYHKTQIRRLAPFFRTFHSSLIQRVAARRDNPDIVLLSPGPDSRIYFEHAILSRYLGYPLVESQDLTVRNGEVFLKKLAGLEPVDAIFRHIADDSIDPFALRRETASGVAGLIQVARERNVDVVNPIGSAFIETPALAAFLPSLCRTLTGADLLLGNHPVWWCGAADAAQYVRDNLEGLSIGPAMSRTAPAPGDAAAAIQAAPHEVLARTPVQPGAAPAWGPQGIHSRYTLLRIFACATEQGFAVMPGGLAITATDVETLTADSPELQQSKDIWVISDQPVVPFSLMSGLTTIAEFSRGSDLPSRVADHLLWLGRYLERAEGVVRLLQSVYRRLAGEARLNDIPELSFLLNLLRAIETLPPVPEDGDDIPRYRELSGQLKDAMMDKDKAESVTAILTRVREAARKVRDRLSLEAWRAINRLEGIGERPFDDPLEILDDIMFTLSAFSGLAMESMTRGLGWRFMDMGRRIERAMNQSRLIRTGLERLCSEQRVALEALLEVSDSIMTYRARYRAAFQLSPVLDLLIVDETNPKSLAFQISQLSAHVDHLPRQGERRFASREERLALQMLTAVRLLNVSDHDCNAKSPRESDLVVFLETIEAQLKEFNLQINAHFLSRVPATPHYALQRESPSK